VAVVEEAATAHDERAVKAKEPTILLRTAEKERENKKKDKKL